MSHPKIRLIATVILGAVLCAAAASANDTTAASKWRAPRTADGHPDLQGTWTNATITPFERPEKYAERLVLSEQEADELEQTEAKFNATADAPTDPKTRVEDLPASCGGGAADGPEMRSLGERCILSFGSSAGPPMIPLLYNNNYQIVQTRDSVMILVEMVHDARVVRLNSKHRPANVRTWMGDSIGWWEGETLVVETTNFRPDQSFRASSQNLKVTERFTRVDPNQILYRFTVEDPETFTRPFSGEVAMNATGEKIYEYACHEGNYALPGILAGARAQEEEAAVKAAEKK
jgi:hypothetical protein